MKQKKKRNTLRWIRSSENPAENLHDNKSCTSVKQKHRSAPPPFFQPTEPRCSFLEDLLGLVHPRKHPWDHKAIRIQALSMLIRSKNCRCAHAENVPPVAAVPATWGKNQRVDNFIIAIMNVVEFLDSNHT